VFSTLEVYYDNALYKFTFDIDIDIKEISIMRNEVSMMRWMCGFTLKERKKNVPLNYWDLNLSAWCLRRVD